MENKKLLDAANDYAEKHSFDFLCYDGETEANDSKEIKEAVLFGADWWRNNVWHKAIEKPKDCSQVLLTADDGTFLLMGTYLFQTNKVVNETDVFYVYDSYYWAYLDDLLPTNVKPLIDTIRKKNKI